MPKIRVLALHGFTGCGDDFEPLRRAAPQAWEWHCPEWPKDGHGGDGAARAGAVARHFAVIDDALAAFEANSVRPLPMPCSFPHPHPHPLPHPHLLPRPLPVLLGYSMGGRLALQWAARHADVLCEKISALVLIGASPGIADADARTRRREADNALADAVCRSGTAAFLEHWWHSELFAGLPKNLSPAALAALRERRLRNAPEDLAASLRGVGAGALPPVWDALPRLHVPTLCAAGANDKKFCAIAAEMAAQLPLGRTFFARGAWHLPHIEKPAALARALVALTR
ncbi:MAG: alpha/beta fold hydrolase [Puniceicoccales bacterium]|nr:alpha/beta fold hydrolase [Puniceicoccales bacterium]